MCCHSKRIPTLAGTLTPLRHFHFVSNMAFDSCVKCPSFHPHNFFPNFWTLFEKHTAFFIIMHSKHDVFGAEVWYLGLQVSAFHLDAFGDILENCNFISFLCKQPMFDWNKENCLSHTTIRNKQLQLPVTGTDVRCVTFLVTQGVDGGDWRGILWKRVLLKYNSCLIQMQWTSASIFFISLWKCPELTLHERKVRAAEALWQVEIHFQIVGFLPGNFVSNSVSQSYNINMFPFSLNM